MIKQIDIKLNNLNSKKEMLEKVVKYKIKKSQPVLLKVMTVSMKPFKRQSPSHPV